MRTAATRRIVLGMMVGVLVGAGGAVPSAAAAPCEALVGKWKWFTGGVVSINGDGTIAHDPGNDGTWECTDPARGRVTLRWRFGGYVNRLALSGDGRALSSTDPSQSYVTAQRIGAPRTVEAPSPAMPAETPRRPETRLPAKPSQTAKATEPQASPSRAADPKPVDPKTTGPTTTPAQKPADAKPGAPPADARKVETSPQAGPSSPPAKKSGQAGPCTGKACMAVGLEIIDGCVWLHSHAGDVVLAEVRLASETIKMTLEKPDAAKVAVVKEADAAPKPPRARKLTPKQQVEALRKGHNVASDPKVEEPGSPTPAPAAAPVDRSRAWHGMTYNPFSGKDEPVFHARIDRAGGCVADRGEILGYRARLASAPPEEERVIPCTGDACPDVDASAEQVGICRIANRGGREITVGIVRSGNKDVSALLPLHPNGTVRLDFFAGCLKADDIGRIEARYK